MLLKSGTTYLVLIIKTNNMEDKDWSKLSNENYISGYDLYQPIQKNPADRSGIGLMGQMQQSNTHQYKNFTAEDLERIIKELNMEKGIKFKNAKPVKKYPRRKLNIAMK